MTVPKFTCEELEARQQARGEITIDTVRDVMCFEDPSLTPEEAAFLLSNRYPQYSYEVFLKSTRLVQQAKDVLAKHENRGKEAP